MQIKSKSEDRALIEAFIGGAVAMLIIVMTIGGILFIGMAADDRATQEHGL